MKLQVNFPFQSSRQGISIMKIVFNLAGGFLDQVFFKKNRISLNFILIFNLRKLGQTNSRLSRALNR